MFFMFVCTCADSKNIIWASSARLCLKQRKHYTAMTEQCKINGVVLHSDSERENAERFCELVNSIDCGDGLFPSIVTFDEFSAPNKQIISNLDDAVSSGRVTFCSEDFYTQDPFGYFAANVAMLHNFVKVKVQRTKQSASTQPLPTISSFTGLDVEEDWSFCKRTKDQLNIFFQRLVFKNENEAVTGMSDLPSEDNLDLANPSMPSMTGMPSRQTQNNAGDTQESMLDVSSQIEAQDNSGQNSCEGPQASSLLPQAQNVGTRNAHQLEGESSQTHACSTCFTCGCLHHCSSKTWATWGALLAVLVVFVVVLVLSVYFSNTF